MKLSPNVSVAGLLLFGTACSLLAKIIYYVPAPTIAGGIEKFEKPWFSVLTMFVGMSACILLDRRHKGALHSDEEKLLLQRNGAGPPRPSPPSVWIINAPTLLDLFATVCGTTGLLYTSVSVYQMLRGAQLVFTAILSVTFLRRKLVWYNWVGILFSCTGISLVGFANILAEDNPGGRANQAFGVLIIVLGQIMQASQVVMEEFLLSDMAMPSIRIVAYEGLFGVLHMLLWVMPIVYFLPGRDHGHLEDSIDSFYMLSHTWGVVFVLSLDMAMMLLYNICGMSVTENLSAVHRVIIETLRTLFVWIVDIFAYYFITHGGFGEAWTSYSFMQLAGFILLVCGTLTYNAKELLSQLETVFPRAADKITPLLSPPSAKPHPLAARGVAIHGEVSAEAADEEAEEEEDEEDEEGHVESYFGSPIGSAPHGSYLASSLPRIPAKTT